MDDLIFIGSSPNVFVEFKKAIVKEFKIFEIGVISKKKTQFSLLKRIC